eukprot:TRINITY_DN970_c0_g1_i1.p1 TRINITY_DN970_c0_g1~~TRINITY_DN970_c0_g1_i1.p1  ORF type:complete len:524 (+),score=86.18 TRINITY_DN970_c0_g1_i1:3507-5078(+)
MRSVEVAPTLLQRRSKLLQTIKASLPSRHASALPNEHDVRPPSSPSSSSSEIDADSVSRPSLYVHEPRARAAPLEEYYGHEPRPIELLDELKSDRLEGFYNLSFMLLAFCLAFLFVRNVLEDGFGAWPGSICFGTLLKHAVRSLYLNLLLPLPFFVAFFITKGMQTRWLTVHQTLILHGLSLLLFFTVATKLLLMAQVNPLFGLIHGMLFVSVALKQHSYVLTNLLLDEETHLRRMRRQRMERQQASASNETSQNTTTTTAASESSQDSRGHSKASSSTRVKYPRNLIASNMLYYAVAPVLVYETSYPRTNTVRVRYVGWYTIQMVVCMLIQYVLIMQFCVPIWRLGRGTDDEPRLLWYMVKLALPSFFIWLLLFFEFFHCALNVVAEVTRFADRQFYREWWNATTLQAFWREWNVLVHEWCLRHLYVEGVSRHKVGRSTAALGTFVLSAILHEYVAFCGFRMLRPYVFVGMLSQLPLMRVSERLKRQRAGNVLMWSMLFVGQCSMGMLYVRDYLRRFGALMC